MTFEEVMQKGGNTSPEDYLQIYLEIQSRLGFLAERSPQPSKGMFVDASLRVLRAKREWLGGIGELTGDNIQHHGRKIPVAVE